MCVSRSNRISLADLVHQSRLAVLASLASFLRIAISPASQHESMIPTWYMASLFQSHSEFIAFCSLIRPRHSSGTDESTIEFKWSNDLQDTTAEFFIGHFNGILDLAVDPGFSMGALGDIAPVVGVLGSNSTTPSHLNSTVTRMAVSTNYPYFDFRPS